MELRDEFTEEKIVHGFNVKSETARPGMRKDVEERNFLRRRVWLIGNVHCFTRHGTCVARPASMRGIFMHVWLIDNMQCSKRHGTPHGETRFNT